MWSGGSTAVPTDRADSKEKHQTAFMIITIGWMVIAITFANMFEKAQIHRLPDSTTVIIFGIIGGLLLRLLHADLSSVFSI